MGALRRRFVRGVYTRALRAPIRDAAVLLETDAGPWGDALAAALRARRPGLTIARVGASGIAPDSSAHAIALARSRILVIGPDRPAWFVARADQVVVCTGAPDASTDDELDPATGIPLDLAARIAPTLRVLLSSTWLLSPGPAATERIVEAYRLRGAFRGRVLEAGGGPAAPDALNGLAAALLGETPGDEVPGAVSLDDARDSLLLHLGSLRTNGITSAALALLGALDHEALDVTVIAGRPRTAEQWANQQRIDPRVRQLHRVDGMPATALDRLHRRFAEVAGRGPVHGRARGQRRMWDLEWRRSVGDARFGRVVDFDGYGPFWATLLLHAPGAVRSIWMHNEMAAETRRRVGRRTLRLSLRAVFARYPEFDALVSVSSALADLNRRDLAAPFHVPPERFVVARNVLDGPAILVRAGEGLAATVPGSPSWIAELGREDRAWFATVGRLSPEKNHARLIRAFARVHRERPDARLVIIGDGPLREELRSLIAATGLDRVAHLAGRLANPFPLLRAADCFVLSSDHEGAPLVLREAALLGLPVVTTAFASVGDALEPGAALVVAPTDAALADGMTAALRGEVPPAHVDVDDTAAVAEFDRATRGGRA